MKLPSDTELKNLLATGDSLRFAIVGFSALESALEALIAESLPSPHPIELKRLSFGLKLDLAIGLGSLSIESKGLLLKLSKIRNYYAHELSPTDYCAPQELVSAMTSQHRTIVGERLETATTFMEVLGLGFIAAYSELTGSIKQVQKYKEHIQDVKLHTKALLEVIGPIPDHVLESSAYHELGKKIEKKKAELQRGKDCDKK